LKGNSSKVARIEQVNGRTPRTKARLFGKILRKHPVFRGIRDRGPREAPNESQVGEKARGGYREFINGRYATNRKRKRGWYMPQTPEKEARK